MNSPNVRHQSYPRVSQLESLSKCQDAEWMRRVGVNTYYPPGTVCYRDPSQCEYYHMTTRLMIWLSSIAASCLDFGSSGSGVVRESLPYRVNYCGEEDQNGDRFVRIKEKEQLSLSYSRTAYQYSFVGPLSLSKGCDYAIPLERSTFSSVTGNTLDFSPLLDYAYRGLLEVSKR